MENTKDHHHSRDQFPTSPSSMTSPFETTSDGSSSLSESVSPSSSDHSHHAFFTENGELANHKKSQRKNTSSIAHGIREHVKMGPNLSETVKGKLSVGAKIIKKGGRENIFRDIFGLIDGEKLFKASQCYLSTTQGPIAGILFISTEKVAFVSERSIPLLHSCSGSSGITTTTRIPYKLTIPVKKIKEANESENKNNPAQKYIEIVTQDEFEFWFMGFVRYEKAFMNLQKAISLCR